MVFYTPSTRRRALDEQQRLLLGTPLAQPHPAFDDIKASFLAAVKNSDRPNVTFPWYVWLLRMYCSSLIWFVCFCLPVLLP